MFDWVINTYNTFVNFVAIYGLLRITLDFYMASRPYLIYLMR